MEFRPEGVEDTTTPTEENAAEAELEALIKGEKVRYSAGESRNVEIRPLRLSDLPFLVVSGLDRERTGLQYPADEWLKQFRIAPLRYFNKSTRSRSFLAVVDGRRAGYVGLNPLSSNIEYYLQPWARGGVGKRAVAEFLRSLLPSHRDERAFMLAGNVRSVMTFRRALESLRLSEDADYEYFTYDGGSGFRVLAGSAPK